ncbi:MAG: hypothetical protein IKR51_06730 [Oscillospiraceae bacterium]|nr:hypothetical protein [Oscillospiraceae bacterium]
MRASAFPAVPVCQRRVGSIDDALDIRLEAPSGHVAVSLEPRLLVGPAAPLPFGETALESLYLVALGAVEIVSRP